MTATSEKAMTTRNTQPDRTSPRAKGSVVWMAAWALLLCAASAGVTLACVRLSGAAGGQAGLDSASGEPADRARFTVEHVQVKSDRPFAAVVAAFESRLGKFDPAVYQYLREGGDPEESRARIEAMAGPSGFMLFDRRDHGKLLRLAGQKKKALQYLVGNPLFAIQMTQHDIRASLYAPLRVLLYEDEEGKTCVEYDRPSAFFGQFANAKVTAVATMLDRKLEQLVARAIQ
jgi:uncharacterized protein (DUF302 family)